MRGDGYSRLIFWLKIILPLIALALLSTLFLLSRVIETETVIPFAEKEIQDRLRDQQVTGPIYQGTTPEGDDISFSAATLTTPEGTTGANQAQDLQATLDMASGGQINLRAQGGQFNLLADSVDLTGDVMVTTSTGYVIESDRLIAQLSALNVTSPGPVRAKSPLGQLDAGGMTLSSDAITKSRQLVFTNGVKLIYTPEEVNE